MKSRKRLAQVISRCKAPIEQRYVSVHELRKDIEDAFALPKKRRHIFIVLLSVLIIVSSSFCLYTLLYNMNESSHDAVQMNQNQAHGLKQDTTIISPYSIQTVEKTHTTQPLHASGKSSDTKTPNLNVFIREGQRKIDAMWQSYGIMQQTDTVKQAQYFIEMNQRCHEFIGKYPTTLPAILTHAEQSAVMTALSAYYSEKYVKPYLNAQRISPQ